MQHNVDNIHVLLLLACARPQITININYATVTTYIKINMHAFKLDVACFTLTLSHAASALRQ